MQAAGLVKVGLLKWKSPKAFFGGACGQDWLWQPESVLEAKSIALIKILRGTSSNIDKVSHVIQSLVGSEGLAIVRGREGF
jgi:hypothetical protein